MRTKPFAYAIRFRGKVIRIQVHHADRLVGALRALQGVKAAVGQLAHVQNERGVAFLYISPRALPIILRFGFAHLVASIQYTVFRAPTERAPAAMWNAMHDGEIQRRAIGAGLATGDDDDWIQIVFGLTPNISRKVALGWADQPSNHPQAGRRCRPPTRSRLIQNSSQAPDRG